MSIETLFWLLVFLILYTYLFYPIVLLSISSIIQGTQDSVYMFDKKERRGGDAIDWPTVAVVISAFNEEKHIVGRIQNLLAQDYPADKLKIYIGSDGSTDNTVALASSIKDDRLLLFDYPVNRGKVSVLNELLSNVKQSVVVFSDANAFFQPDALKKLTRHFVGGHIAGVCGELNLVNKNSGDNQDGVYWRLERFLKFHESKINGFLGANGAIYALKRECCRPLPVDTIIDDFTMFMRAALEGHKTLYDAEAVAEEEIVSTMSGEYGRRVRIGTGNYQAFFRLLQAFHPKHKLRVFTYISHKVIRWFTPHFMLMLLIINTLLLAQPFYQLLFMMQLLLYLTVFGIVNFKKNHRFPALIALPVFLITMNVALAHGFVNYVFVNNTGTWKRTER
jgi:cellulose synthase/poly-beta-1,6-N-acetylglucosamine synthase-like glycosyltransferase